MTESTKLTSLLNQEPGSESFLEEVLAGLQRSPKTLPCKYFYDERGSRLFDAICELDEYYLTRTELEIMKRFAPEMADQIGPGVMLVEYGSGSSIKTRILLDHLHDPVAYVPVDISREHLHRVADELSQAYPAIEVLPVCADFTEEFTLPRSQEPPTHSAVYFPGSTIGNFQPHAARALLARIAPLCGTGGGLLIGIDLQKDVETLEAAYNDSEGVTADFNRNLLRRINRELDANFDLDSFAHRADYNSERGRVELYLESLDEQSVRIGEELVVFAAGERICTEYSHKYTIDSFAAMAADVGLALHRSWQDERGLFAVLHFAVMD